MRILDANSSDIYIYFTRDEMDTCYHSGACDNGTAHILSINRDLLETIPIENARKVLKACGIDEIDEMDNDSIYAYILWIAAGNASDNSENEEFPSYDSITGEFESIISIY